jgi:flagellar assembly factor FliW
MQTTRFGTVEIDDSQIITLPTGLLGFSMERHFVLLNDEGEGSPFQWLHSVDTPDLAFVVIDPQFAFPEYAVTLTEDHLRRLEAASLEELTVRCIITMARELTGITVNLQGPLLFNMPKRLGLQLVIPDGKYSTRQPLFGDKQAAATAQQEENANKERKHNPRNKRKAANQ